MTDVRYAPPVAEVADAVIADRGPMPKQVTLAVRVLWVSFCLGFPIAIYYVRENPPTLAPLLLFSVFYIVVYSRLAPSRPPLVFASEITAWPRFEFLGSSSRGDVRAQGAARSMHNPLSVGFIAGNSHSRGDDA